MRSMNLIQLFGGVAVAGAVAAGSTALTGTGLATSGNAAQPQFVGGTVSQSVEGATLTDVEYTFADTTNTAVHAIKLTFSSADVDGRHVAVTLTGGTGGVWTCEDIGDTVTKVSNCTTTADRIGLTSLDVTVS